MTVITNESGKLGEAKQNPAAMFDEPQDVLAANDLSKDEKRAILEQWKIDSMQLQQAADENMTGGEPSRIEDVVEALKTLDAN
ncbi:MAG: hypothetical protein WDN76_11005 [Alphaproteobacteria bacterium]